MSINNEEKKDRESYSIIENDGVEMPRPVVPSSSVEDDIELPKPQFQPTTDKSDYFIGYESSLNKGKKKSGGKIHWGALSLAAFLTVAGIRLTTLEIEAENLRGANARLTETIQKDDAAMDFMLEQYGRVYDLLERQSTPKSYIDKTITYEDGCKESYLHEPGMKITEYLTVEKHSHTTPVSIEYTDGNGNKEVYDYDSTTGQYVLRLEQSDEIVDDNTKDDGYPKLVLHSKI